MGETQVHRVSRKATAAIAPSRIVQASVTDGYVTQASAAAQKLVGVAGVEGADAAEEHLDVAVGGVARVEYGGVVAYGDLLTSDALGRAVVAVTTNNVIGQAQEKGVLGTLGTVLIAPSKLP